MKKGKKSKRFIGNDRTFGSALKHFREVSGLTQTDWADGWLKLDRSDEFTSWREKRRLNNNEKISKAS